MGGGTKFSLHFPCVLSAEINAASDALPIWRSKSSIARRGVSNFVQLSSVNRRKVIILWLGPRNTSTQERYVLNDQEGLMKKTEKKARDKIGAFNSPRLLACTEVLRPAFA
jgi:hypothetical protein